MLDNTGKLVFQWLEQIDANTGLPTGLRKPNDPADADYVPPTWNYEACPLPYVWVPIDGYCEAASFYCAPGYTLSADEKHCNKTGTATAVAPATPYKTVGVSNDQFWSNYAYLYSLGTYTPTGGGSASYIGYMDNFWTNVNATATDGPMNRCGLWVDNNNDGNADVVTGKWMGFVATLDVPADETVFVGISAGAAARIFLTNADGTNQTVVSYSSSTLYREWRIFEVQLRAGKNLVQMEGYNGVSTPMLFAAEIYRNTASDFYTLTGAEMNVVWSSVNFRGQNFQTGEGGYSCPAGYALDYNNGSPVCRQILADPVKQHNSGKIVYRNRKRTLRGVDDGYVEPNIQGEGEGPYFPPATDTVTCPIN
ncbi:hypothetical protein [Chitinophaga sp. sic0106]|uniref:hypothetical protein n=1 Tax=Chitinophaga sp. sic0106 TaxID=2854785 RepID=UPI001C49126E|nr:hypothetical protein [Chitinophaga sp. sic0106]MBV7533767.1 hypothetical protein [Chitinophaga sp. sic0106]